MGIAPCDIIAHSFGGRVALYLAANEPQLVKRLLLTGCAGIKKPQTPEQQKRSARYQRLKGIVSIAGPRRALQGAVGLLSELRQKYGSPDYNALSEDMKKTFVKVVNEVCCPLLPRVQASTLLVWGENDTETPLWMGQQIGKGNPRCGACHL
ncbi:MAG: alpha/beta hydrolase [Christensenellales bacterium]